MVRQKIMLAALVVFLLVISSSTALAHRMLIEMPEEGLVLVRYDDGTVAQLATVTIYDSDGNAMLKGKTDDMGLFKYDRGIQPYRIVANDGMGHRASWTEGEVDIIDLIPRWQRALLGVALLVFIAAVANHRKNKRSAC